MPDSNLLLAVADDAELVEAVSKHIADIVSDAGLSTLKSCKDFVPAVIGVELARQMTSHHAYTKDMYSALAKGDTEAARKAEKLAFESVESLASSSTSSSDSSSDPSELQGNEYYRYATEKGDIFSHKWLSIPKVIHTSKGKSGILSMEGRATLNPHSQRMSYSQWDNNIGRKVLKHDHVWSYHDTWQTSSNFPQRTNQSLAPETSKTARVQMTEPTETMRAPASVQSHSDAVPPPPPTNDIPPAPPILNEDWTGEGRRRQGSTEGTRNTRVHMPVPPPTGSTWDGAAPSLTPRHESSNGASSRIPAQSEVPTGQSSLPPLLHIHAGSMQGSQGSGNNPYYWSSYGQPHGMLHGIDYRDASSWHQSQMMRPVEAH